MRYNEYTLENVKTDLGLNVIEDVSLFTDITPARVSDFLQTALKKFVPLALAINSAKSRSEWISTPILAEVHEQLQHQISLFSAIKFTVEPERGLDGYCDYLISRSREQYYLNTPAVAIVEAKKENSNEGLGQCIATMYATQTFNARKANPVNVIYGSVTTGTNWKFLKLLGCDAIINSDEYPTREIERLIGLPQSLVMQNNEAQTQ
jgi:hypothetical protein